jgi:hypothetical protein
VPPNAPRHCVEVGTETVSPFSDSTTSTACRLGHVPQILVPPYGPIAPAYQPSAMRAPSTFSPGRSWSVTS